VSLIDEALKRAQAAQGEKARPEADKRPWTPAPLPDQGRIRRGRTIRTAALVALVVLAGLAAFLFLRARPSEAPQVVRAPTALLPLPPGEGRGEGKTAVNANSPKPTPAPRSRAATPAVHVGPVSSAAAASEAPGPTNSRPSSLVNGRVYVGSVTLAGGVRIELGGIVYSESNATALVNGKILGTGAFVEGFVIQRIEENRIELADASGLTIFVSLK
jgi:hypothetical protein